MKKLIITENQFNLLRESILLEANKKDRGPMGDFVKIVNEQLKEHISTANIGDNIDFMFGQNEEDGCTLIKDSSFQIIFKIITLDTFLLKLEYINSSRHNNIMEANDNGIKYFNFYPEGVNGVHYNNGECSIGFKPISFEKDENGNNIEKEGTVINVNLFRGVLPVDKATKTNTNEMFDNYQEAAKEACKKFNSNPTDNHTDKSTDNQTNKYNDEEPLDNKQPYKRFNTKELEYKAGWFNFNNWFIPATGKGAIDNTLASFGLYVNSYELNNGNRNNIKTKIKILDDLITANGDTLQPKTLYAANIQDNLIIVYNRNTRFIFDTGNQDIMNGGEFICDVSYQGKNNIEIPLEQKSKINILKPR